MASGEQSRAFRKPAVTETMTGAKDMRYQPMPWALAPRVRRPKPDTNLTTTLTSSQSLLTYNSATQSPSYAYKNTENGKLPRTYVVLARKNENKDTDDKELQNLIIVDSKIISDKIELDLEKRGVKLENLVSSKSFQTFSQKNQEKLLQRMMPHSTRKDVSSYMTARAKERGIRGPMKAEKAPGAAAAAADGTFKTYGVHNNNPLRGSSPVRDRRHVAPAPTGTTQAHERVLSTVVENETRRGQHACSRTEALANRVSNNSRTDTVVTETLKTETMRGTPTRAFSPQREAPVQYGRIRREAFQNPSRPETQLPNRNFVSRAETYNSVATRPDLIKQTLDLHRPNDFRLPSASLAHPPEVSIPRPLGAPGPPEPPDDKEGVDISDWLQRSKTPKEKLSMPAPPQRSPSRGAVNDVSLLRRPKNPTNRMASATRVMTGAQHVSDATPVVEHLGNQAHAVLPDNYGPTDAYRKCLNWINSLPDSFTTVNAVLDPTVDSQSSTAS